MAINELSPQPDTTVEYLKQNPPEAFYVLSASVTRRLPGEPNIKRVIYPDQIIWQPTGYFDPDPRGLAAEGPAAGITIGGGIGRVEAAIDLGKLFPDIPIVMMSTSTNNYSGKSDAAIMADAARLNGMTNPIQLLESPIDTVTENLEIIRDASVNKRARIGIVTNGFHIERVLTMADSILRSDTPDQSYKLARHLQKLEAHFPEPRFATHHAYYRHVFDYLYYRAAAGLLADLMIQVVNAEMVLLRRPVNDPVRQDVVNALNHPDYQKQITINRTGAAKWRAGVY